MNNLNIDPCELLDLGVSGFHQYILERPFRLSFVSRNLSRLLGFSADELLDGSPDGYAALIHPADRERYADFLERLAASPSTHSIHYRITAKSGALLHVCDTATSLRAPDGTLVANSTLADVTELRSALDDLRFLSETIPCGFLRYTCEKQPRITYINDRMLSMLGFDSAPDGGEQLELCCGNIYLMIPVEERQRFADYLERVCAGEAPLAGEMTALRCDGTRARLFGWVTKYTDEQGNEEFQSVCMDVTERYAQMKERERDRYIRALTDVYDKIFEYDLAAGTVTCIYGEQSPVFRHLQNIPMQMQEATRRWIDDNVCDDDRERVHEFFAGFFRRDGSDSARPRQISYRALSSHGAYRTYNGVFLEFGSSTSLFCCRAAQESARPDALHENMQEFMTRFTDGIAAFEVIDDTVTPLYASDNVCEFFGFTREEWLPMMKRPNPIKTFVARSGVAYEEFVDLLTTGEAEFTYIDTHSGAERRIRAICSRKFHGDGSPRYVMLYNVDPDGTSAGRPAVSIRTFGYFDVFVDDKPIAFRSAKSKELFALLVDRRGGYVSSEEAISFLWEDEPVSPVTLARYRKVALRLKNILEEYGISDAVESVDGKRRIVPERVQCDLYDYLSGGEEHAQLFKGSYLTNYSWGETTLGELMGETF